jgi:hypothetical protein
MLADAGNAVELAAELLHLEGEALLKFLGTETGRKVRRALLAYLDKVVYGLPGFHGKGVAALRAAFFCKRLRSHFCHELDVICRFYIYVSV